MRAIFLTSLLFLTACSLQVVPAEQVTPTVTPPLFATATLAPTLTPRPSATIAIPTVAPTIAPVSAMMTTQVNVRSAPDASAASLGLLNYGNRVQVIGKDESEKWWQIIYPQDSATTGWVSMTYVQIAPDDAIKIPVVRVNQPTAPPTESAPAVGGTPPAPSATGTPAAVVYSAKAKAQIFVRSGPGQTFDSKGMLNAGTIVTLTGRSQNNVWVQIQYDAGVNGLGWVAAAYLEGADLSGLPYFDNQGQPIGSATGAPVPAGQVTPTGAAYSPAADDGDSQKNPAVRLTFSPDSAREFTYSSDLSSPSGDAADWVAFTPYEPTNQSTYVYFKLECSGNGAITAILQKDGKPVADVKTLLCGNYGVAMKVLGGQEYMLVLNADGSAGVLRYVRYTVHVRSQP